MATVKSKDGFEGIVSSNLESAKFEDGRIIVRFKSGSAYTYKVPEGDTKIWSDFRKLFDGKKGSAGKFHAATIKMLSCDRIDDWK